MQLLKNRSGKENAVTLIIILFVTLLIGVIAAPILAGQTSLITNPTTVTGESLDISGARTITGNNINESYEFTLANSGLASEGGWVNSSISITNASGTTLAGNYTVNYTSKVITFANNTYMISQGGAGNITLVDYQYYPLDYITESFGRRVLDNILIGIFALLILVVAVAGVYQLLKRSQ